MAKKTLLWRVTMQMQVVLILVVLSVVFVLALIDLSGRRARMLVALTATGQESWLHDTAQMILSHLAGLPEVKKLNQDSCKVMESDWENGNGLFSLMAVGDSQGNTVCVLGSEAKAPLPTMKDRVYFQKAKTAEGLVIGEYIVGKLTGKSVINYAYPIKDAQGEFRGVVMLGVDLGWFPRQLIDKSFNDQDAKVTAVDMTGKVLFNYPSSEVKPGDSVVGVELLGQLLRKDWSYKLLKGYDGKYRIYAHEPIGDKESGMIIFSGVSLYSYKLLVGIYIVLSLLILILAAKLAPKVK